MRGHMKLGIKQLTAGYINGQFSPKAVTEQALKDAKNLKTLNAFACLAPEQALQQAEDSTERYAQQKPIGGLDGITIAIKDNFCTSNLPTTCASRMLKDFVPPYDATVADRLRAAGAILLGKTNMDQFAMGAGTVDSIYGPTKNIWSEDLSQDNWRIAGGSSGGSASAVAAGLCYAAIGSDTGGSTRNPASYCGVIGLKPTYGLCSRHGLIPLVNSMDVPGIVTRSISDSVEILNAVAGPDHLDSTTIQKSFKRLQLPEVDQIDLRSLRIGIPKEYHCEGLTAEVLETWTKVADLLECAGAHVQQVSLPNTASSIFVYSILNQCEVASNMARYDGIEYGHRSEDERSTEQLYAQSRAEGFNQVVKTRILTGNFLLLRKNYEHYFEKALRVRRLIADDFAKVFKPSATEHKVDILLTPTTLSDAPLYKDFASLSNRDQCAVQDFCTQPANMAGIPAVSLPVRLSKAGLPLSLQLMSNHLNEQLLLTVARWIEAQVEFDCLESLEKHVARD
ncbi:glutamyl-tRNA(Gln) amidotransferase subunit A, mitochondrial [Drosophila grimshawi]|uniref:Glutamyl-tRNA(Gln) amidotransferase subunit A, mitochondrial n=1 Tax=Drosophila grimshawi TaxID=7222 RepID=B4JYK4_DROGR|nr:glutamyl-tRNA(Gln) amidotransferase subunit A, mitochondrial [Drosophila grimshawi]EDV90766.1 GH13996 [Drosophila grimshawi]